jgi:hypothetical protein
MILKSSIARDARTEHDTLDILDRDRVTDLAMNLLADQGSSSASATWLTPHCALTFSARKHHRSLFLR